MGNRQVVIKWNKTDDNNDLVHVNKLLDLVKQHRISICSQDTTLNKPFMGVFTVTAETTGLENLFSYSETRLQSYTMEAKKYLSMMNVNYTAERELLPI